MEETTVISKMVGKYTVITITGDITISIEKDIIALINGIEKSSLEKNIIIDFENVNYINSSGIALLIKIINKVKSLNGNIIFSSMSNHIEHIMRTVGIIEIVPNFENLKTALEQ